MKRSQRLIAGVSAALLIAGAAPVAPAVAQEDPPACTYCAGGEYHPVVPTRIFDSRSPTEAELDRPINDVAPLGAKPMSSLRPTFDIQLLGLDDAEFDRPWVPAGVESNNVLALAVSITVISPTSRGFLGAYPAGSPSFTSILNFGAGQTVANLSIVRPGVDDFLTIFLHGDVAGSAHVVVDVYGWFSTTGYDGDDDVLDDAERGGRLIAVSPGRVLDTRPSSVGPGSVTELTIRGVDTIGPSPVVDLVPDSADVVGVLVNVTIVTPTANTFVSVVPEAPSGLPSTSNLNTTVGVTKANMAMVPVGADGKIRLYHHAGSSKLIVDVLGYIQRRLDDTREGRVIPLTAPFRALDTRQPAFGAVPLGPGQAEDWSFASFVNSVTVSGVPVGNQSALLGNLTNARLDRQYPTVAVTSYLTVYPTPPTAGDPPTVSNLNSVESSTTDPRAVPNMALVKYGTDTQVRVFNSKGYAHYILDVSAVVLAD